MKLRRNSREARRCIFDLHETCRVYELLKDVLEKEGIEWGSREFVKTYCAMCIKAVYAKAHLEKAEAIKVVNTL